MFAVATTGLLFAFLDCRVQADGKYEATAKNANTDNKRDAIDAGIDGRMLFLQAQTINQIRAPKPLAAVMKRNTGQRLTQVDHTFIRDGLPTLN